MNWAKQVEKEYPSCDKILPNKTRKNVLRNCSLERPCLIDKSHSRIVFINKGVKMLKLTSEMMRLNRETNKHGYLCWTRG